MPSPVDRKEIFGWSMFDFANSAFTTVMVTAFFPLYFVGTVVGQGPGENGASWWSDGDVLWGIALAITKMLVILTAPLLGALADFTGAKKRFLFALYVGCIAMTAALGFVGPGDVIAAMALFVGAAWCFSSTEYFYSAFLPEIAPRELMGRISATAWGLGYFGGLGALVCAVLILGATQGRGHHWVWLMVSAWFLIGGLPTFLFVRERRRHEPTPPGQTLLTVGFARVGRTVREAARFRQFFRFMGIYTIFNCGIEAVIGFASLIARDLLGFNDREMGIFLIVLNVSAALGAFGAGWLQDRWGSRRTIVLALCGWVAATVLAAGLPALQARAGDDWAEALFWVAGNVVGASMGAVFSASRALVGLFSPADRTAEFYGLWALFSRVGAVIGPLLFGVASFYWGRQAAVVSLGFFFVIGLVLMYFVDEQEGIKASGHWNGAGAEPDPPTTDGMASEGN